MVMSSVGFCAWLEMAVMLFQFCGVVALCVTRLASTSVWADRGRIGFVFSLVGLGVAGALCGGNDSEFALFAGGTMTFLLIGMTIGSGHDHATHTTGVPARAEANLVG